MNRQQSSELVIRDLPARIIGIPLVSLLMGLLFSFFEGKELWRMEGILLAFLHTFFYWEGLRIIWIRLQRRLPHYDQTIRRLVLLAASILIFGLLATVVITLLAHFIAGTACTLEHMMVGFLFGLPPTFLVTILYETVYFFHAWKQKVIETESLARIQLVSQLELLQSRMDPHFLFNSLNVLSSLIDENEPAQQYLNRLAKVYRYVLLSRDKETVSLREELAMVESYLYLAQVRFRQGLHIQMALSEEVLDSKVAPMALQQLVENALKHNVITQSKPLQLVISSSNGRLSIKNNLQPLAIPENSTGLGLDNLRARYLLLGAGEVTINQDANHFEVQFPLIPG